MSGISTGSTGSSTGIGTGTGYGAATDWRVVEQHRELVMATIGSSSAGLPPCLADALGTLVASALAARDGRSRAAVERSLARSDAIAAGILEAAGALPCARGAAGITQRRILRRGPEAYGLKRVPDLETIRRALAARHAGPTEKQERVSEPEPSNPSAGARSNPGTSSTESTESTED